jgi:hypothetical protein
VLHANEHEHLREEGDIGDDESGVAASKEGKSKAKLRRLECGRCQTVAYCCKGVCVLPIPERTNQSVVAVHQKEDWSGMSSSFALLYSNSFPPFVSLLRFSFPRGFGSLLFSVIHYSLVGTHVFVCFTVHKQRCFATVY